MIVRLRNPVRELTYDQAMSVTKLLRLLDVPRESVLLIRNGELVPGDAQLGRDDEIEIRPVISGGA